MSLKLDSGRDGQIRAKSESGRDKANKVRVGQLETRSK